MTYTKSITTAAWSS